MTHTDPPAAPPDAPPGPIPSLGEAPAPIPHGGKTALLNALGEDLVFSWFERGESTLQIAQRLGMSTHLIWTWLQTPEERKARYRLALAAGAEHYEQDADAILQQAHRDALANPLVASALVSVARERAQGAWRRAAVRDPVRYDAARGKGGDVHVNVDNRRATKIEVSYISAKPRPALPAPDVIDADDSGT